MKMVKKVLSAAMATALMACAFNASAGSDATLKVIGSIVPGACVPSLPNGGIVDFQTWRNGQIAPTGVANKLVQLGTKTINLTVTCDTEISVAIVDTDNRLDSRVGLNGSTAFIAGSLADGGNLATSSGAFGLGKAPNGANIGAYSLAIDVNNTTADGTKVDVIYVTNGVYSENRTWAKTTTGALCPLNGGCNTDRGSSVAETGTTTPKAFKVLNAPLLVGAAVQDNTVLGTAETINLDGNATISLVYL